jgi:hypothetical protein
MEWYYSVNDERRGPVTATELKRLVRTGVVAPFTPIWREGLPTWMPYVEAINLQRPPAPDEVICYQCGKIISRAGSVWVGDATVCAACNLVYLGRLAQANPTIENGVWRWGRRLVVWRNADLPKRCVKCNSSTDIKMLRQRLSVMEDAESRLYSTVYIGFCARHRRLRTVWLAVFFALAAMAFACIVTGAAVAKDDPTRLVEGGIAFLGACISVVLGVRAVSALEILPDFTVIGGVCKAFLAELPVWNEQ